MVYKKNYLNIVICIALIIVLAIGGFIVYKGLNKDNKPKEEKQEEKTKISPLLYEVTKEGSSNKIYLFGSIHVANKDDLVFPEYILEAYNNSHYLACEIDAVNNEKEAEQLLLNNIAYTDGTTIKDHLKETTYNKLINFLTEKKSYINSYEYFKPYFFFSLISDLSSKDANLSSKSGIDNYFINKATKDNKTILEVESIESQMNLLFSFSDTLYDVAISEMIDEYDTEVKGISDLYNSWKTGNIDEMLKLENEDIEIKDDYTEEEKAAINDYNKRLISDRNLTMTDKAIEYFNNNQDVFFMVGTLHIIGDDGIAKNLEKKGYTVKRVE